jgi:hypothetical protein
LSLYSVRGLNAMQPAVLLPHVTAPPPPGADGSPPSRQPETSTLQAAAVWAGARGGGQSLGQLLTADGRVWDCPTPPAFWAARGAAPSPTCARDPRAPAHVEDNGRRRRRLGRARRGVRAVVNAPTGAAGGLGARVRGRVALVHAAAGAALDLPPDLRSAGAGGARGRGRASGGRVPRSRASLQAPGSRSRLCRLRSRHPSLGYEFDPSPTKRPPHPLKTRACHVMPPRSTQPLGAVSLPMGERCGRASVTRTLVRADLVTAIGTWALKGRRRRAGRG